ncbi:hypothetical protein Ahy_B03g063319 [Arachis hypogaea]|uniref:Uncharacterized protein n=1 Tax=Arachis hypogaea TaxID=3818 RepID=A0A444ZX00_ARAHY|nr:hypothetical protein Ahy_B03g063319 [Arachis hypogaea]
MHHVIEVVVGGDGDEGVEVLSGELVLESEVLRRGAVAEGSELREEGGELDVAVDGEDLGVAANVGELVVVAARLDLAAVAAHELGLEICRRRLLLVPRRRILEVDLPRPRRRLAGFRIRSLLVPLPVIVSTELLREPKPDELETHSECFILFVKVFLLPVPNLLAAADKEGRM